MATQFSQEPERILIPEIQKPSSFLDYMDGVRGRQLAKFTDTRVPIYEQERFERAIRQFIITYTGTGAETFFYLDLGRGISYRVNSIDITNEATARVWQAYRQVATGLNSWQRFVQASVTIGGSSSSQLVGKNRGASITYSGSTPVTLLSDPFEIYGDPKPQELYSPDRLEIRCATIAAAQVVVVGVEIEEIPNPAAYRYQTEGFTIST